MPFLFCVFHREDMGFVSYDYTTYTQRPVLREQPDLRYKVIPLLIREELDCDTLNYIDDIRKLIPENQSFHSVVYCLNIPPMSIRKGEEVSISLNKANDIVGCISFAVLRAEDGTSICCLNDYANKEDTNKLKSGFLRHPPLGLGQKKIEQSLFDLPQRLINPSEAVKPLTTYNEISIPAISPNQHSFWTSHKPEILTFGTLGLGVGIGATFSFLMLAGIIPPLGMTLALAVLVTMAVSEVLALGAGVGVYTLTAKG